MRTSVFNYYRFIQCVLMCSMRTGTVYSTLFGLVELTFQDTNPEIEIYSTTTSVFNEY